MLKEEIYATIESGDIEKALDLLNNYAKTSDHEQLFEAAELYYELGHVEQAKHIINQLLELYPDEGSLFILAAEMMIDADEEDEAIEQLLEVREDDDSFLQAQLLLADLYQLQALDEVAEQKLLAAAKKAPEEMIITYALGEFYLDQGSYNKAIPYLKRALHADLGEVNVALGLAEAYSANGQFEDALHLYHQQEVTKMPPNTLFNFGFTAYQQGDYSVAIEQLEAVKALDADFTSVYAPLARAYEAENRLKESLEVVESGLRMDEFNDLLPLLAGKLLLKMSDLTGSEQYFRQAIALNPANVEALQALAALLRDQERAEELDELISHAKEYGETDGLLTWYHAYAKAELEHYKEALILYQEAYVFLHTDSDFLKEYSSFLLEEGQRDQAIRVLKEALIHDPAKQDIAELLDQLEANA